MIGTPLFSFEHRAKGTLYRLTASHFAQRFWLEMEDAPDWLALLEDQSWLLKRAFEVKNQFELRARVEKVVANHELWRAFEWREDDEKLFVLWRSRFHFWLDPRSDKMVKFDSQIEWHKGSFWTQPGAHFAARFAVEVAHFECDARTALAFLRASPLERNCWNVVWKRGGWPEIEAVMSAALRIEFDQASALQQWPDSYSTVLVWLDDNHVPPTGRLQRLLEVVDERNVRLMQSQFRPKRGGFQLRVHIDTPSMHDKLEASFFLRDWLREFAPQLLPDWT